MNKDITIPTLIILVLLVFCLNGLQSDDEIINQCESDSCKYAVVAH